MVKLKSKISLVILLVVMLFGLTGCANIDTQFKINGNGTIDATVITLINKESYKKLLDESGAGISEDEKVVSLINAQLVEEKKVYEEKGYKTTDISEEGNIGFKATKKFKNVNELHPDTYEVKGLVDFKIEEEKGFFKTKQEIKANLDLRMVNGNEQTIEENTQYFKYKFTLQLPYKPESNNATEISDNGKTLIWNLSLGNKNEIQATGEKTNVLNIVVLVAGTVGLFGVVAFVIITTNRRIKKIEQ